MTAAESPIECLNPVNREVIATLPCATEDQLREAIQRAVEASERWGATRLTDRARLITSVRKRMIREMEDIIDVICAETGKPRFDGLVEIFLTAEMMRFAASEGPHVLARESRRWGILKHKRKYVYYRPHGVVGILSPWNYPLILSAGTVAQAWMAGNSVVLKPSEYAPLTALRFKAIVEEEGAPAGLLEVVTGRAAAGQQIVSSPSVDMVCFIGSVAVGRKIGVRCAELMKPCLLELGGKDPMIVFRDADVERAARAAVWGAFANSGQTCIAIEQVLVEEEIAGRFLERVRELAKQLRVGGDGSACDLGPMANERQYRSVLSKLDEARGKGATVEALCSVSSGLNGWFIPPTLVVDPPEGIQLLTTETFGPVLVVNRFRNAEEAIRRANASGYGLGSAIFTSSRDDALKTAASVKSGALCINDVLTNYLAVGLPFGGVGLSGVGRLQGEEGLRSFCRTQAVLEDRLAFRKEPWWFPVPEPVKKGFRLFTRWFYG